MKLLIVTATRAEIAPFIDEFFPGGELPAGETAASGAAAVHVLITGVGGAATVYLLTKALQKAPFDMVINAGIAGSFDPDLDLGAVLQIVSDGFADLGAEDDQAFLDVFQLGLADADAFPFSGGKLLNQFREPGLPEASGLTVNTAHGNTQSIAAVRSRFPAMTESMEGAAFFYVCMNEQIPCLQLRAVSNYVEKRKRENWDIALAVKNLNAALSGIVKRYI